MAQQQIHAVTFPPTDSGNAVCQCGGWSGTWASVGGRDRAIARAAQHISDEHFSLQMSRKAGG